jgi:hypothetical protein
MTLGQSRGIGAGDGQTEQAICIAEFEARKKYRTLDFFASANRLDFA